MVEGQAQVHHPADGDGVVEDNGTLLHRLGGQDASLGVVDDRPAEDAAQGAGVVHGERAALHVLQPQGSAARPIRKIGDGVGEASDAQPVRVVDHRHHQAGGRSHRDAQVDAPLEDDAVLTPGRIHGGVVFQGGGDGLQRKGQVGQVHALPGAESVPLPVAQADQFGDVHLHHAPRMRNLRHRAHHGVGDHAAHGGQLNTFLVSRKRCGRCGWCSSGNDGRRCGRRGDRCRLFLQVAQHIVPGDAPAHAGAGDMVNIQVVLGGQPAHGRRQAVG